MKTGFADPLNKLGNIENEYSRRVSNTSTGHWYIRIIAFSAYMEMALHGEGHEGSGEGGGQRGPNDGGGVAGMRVISPNRSALNGMGEFLLSQVGCFFNVV